MDCRGPPVRGRMCGLRNAGALIFSTCIRIPFPFPIFPWLSPLRPVEESKRVPSFRGPSGLDRANRHHAQRPSTCVDHDHSAFQNRRRARTRARIRSCTAKRVDGISTHLPLDLAYQRPDERSDTVYPDFESFLCLEIRPVTFSLSITKTEHPSPWDVRTGVKRTPDNEWNEPSSESKGSESACLVIREETHDE